jgi:hypothetical protein
VVTAARAIRAGPEPADGVPVVLAIDIEPDGKPSSSDDPIVLDGFRATVEWLEELRPNLTRATGRPVHFAWFLRMDPQIESLGGTADALAVAVLPELMELRRRGDGIGLHTHAGRWDGVARRWLVDHGSPDWIEHCVRTAFRTYTQVMGMPCRQHRFGDRWTSPAALDLLAELGANVDLSEEPGKGRVKRVDTSADATGEIPSYRHLRSEARPHRDPRLWLLPLTSADPGPALTSPIRVARRVRFFAQPLHRPLALNRSWRSADAYWSLVERALDRQATPYLALAIRSDFVQRPDMTAMRGLLDALPSRALASRLRFTDAVGAIEMLRNGLAAATSIPEHRLAGRT